eukprot:843891-Alexandrium_andersonii.AAC.1
MTGTTLVVSGHGPTHWHTLALDAAQSAQPQRWTALLEHACTHMHTHTHGDTHGIGARTCVDIGQ